MTHINKPSILIVTKNDVRKIWEEIEREISNIVKIDYSSCTKDTAEISTPLFKIRIDLTKNDGFKMSYKGHRHDLILFDGTFPRFDDLEHLQHVLHLNKGCYFDYEDFTGIKGVSKYVNLHCYEFHVLEADYGKDIFGDKWYSWFRWGHMSFDKLK